MGNSFGYTKGYSALWLVAGLSPPSMASSHFLDPEAPRYLTPIPDPRE
jgi:hypothetical protein